MVLFDKKNELYDFLENKKTHIKNEIATYKIDTFKDYRHETLKEYLINKYKIENVPTLIQDSLILSKERIQKEEDIRDPVFSHDPYETIRVNIEYVKINCKIEFKGDKEWFFYRPNLQISNENFNVVISDERYVEFCIYIKYNDIKYIQNKDEYIKNKYNPIISNINAMLNSEKKMIEKYNNSLPIYISSLLEQQIKKEKEINSVLDSINIPLKRNPNATNTVPVPLIPKITNDILFPQKEKIGEIITEYSISDKDYNNIINIIHLVSTMMENAAFTFNRLEEENLRDVLLVALNSHYEKMATGETFRKRGKTDILIQFEENYAYIGECKIWHGKAQIGKAVKQLLDYCTWRDTKTSLIYFSKNKDFKNVLNTFEKYLLDKENKKIISYKKIKQNMWQCDVLKTKNMIVKINIAFYSLDIEN